MSAMRTVDETVCVHLIYSRPAAPNVSASMTVSGRVKFIVALACTSGISSVNVWTAKCPSLGWAPETAVPPSYIK